MPLPPAYPKPSRYSMTEQPTGKRWINGKEIHRKVVDLGQLPNATSKTVAHGIASLGDVVDLRGIAKMGSNSIPLPFVKIAATEQQVQLSQDGDDITVAAGTDRSGFTGLAVIEYTKD